MKADDYTLSPEEVSQAQAAGKRLDALIAKLREENSPDVRFYEGFRSNLTLLESGICGKFIGLMRYQLGDSWQWGMDPALDKIIEPLIYDMSKDLDFS